MSPPRDTTVPLTRTNELEPINDNHLTKAFDEFWSIYPHKKDKPQAKRAFEKALKRTDLQTILDGAERYRDDPNRDQGYTKNPSTWLNADAWENPPEPPKTQKLTAAEQTAQLYHKYKAAEDAEETRAVEAAPDFGLRLKGVDDL